VNSYELQIFDIRHQKRLSAFAGLKTKLVGD